MYVYYFSDCLADSDNIGVVVQNSKWPIKTILQLPDSHIFYEVEVNLEVLEDAESIGLDRELIWNNFNSNN